MYIRVSGAVAVVTVGLSCRSWYMDQYVSGITLPGGSNTGGAVDTTVPSSSASTAPSYVFERGYRYNVSIQTKVDGETLRASWSE
jgi:hypothetical protein